MTCNIQTPGSINIANISGIATKRLESLRSLHACMDGIHNYMHGRDQRVFTTTLVVNGLDNSF